MLCKGAHYLGVAWHFRAAIPEICKIAPIRFTSVIAFTNAHTRGVKNMSYFTHSAAIHIRWLALLTIISNAVIITPQFKMS